MRQLPDPKTVVDSVADGAVDLAEVAPRVATNVAGVATVFANSVKSNMDEFKTRMPDDPSVIPDVLIKGAGQTVQAGLGMIEGIGKGLQDTFTAIQGQIRRVTGS